MEGLEEEKPTKIPGGKLREERLKRGTEDLRLQGPFSERELTGKEIGACLSSGRKTEGAVMFSLQRNKPAVVGEVTGGEAGARPWPATLTPNSQILTWLSPFLCLASTCPSHNEGLGRLI